MQEQLQQAAASNGTQQAPIIWLVLWSDHTTYDKAMRQKEHLITLSVGECRVCQLVHACTSTAGRGALLLW